ncbi:hypothetical protein [Arhodomonas sp. AD133]|uniref:hypothetical protein n=1 Tax=Arhodomonas sp. AD133 TaxID=3415009 RepID=UPI003EB9D46E
MPRATKWAGTVLVFIATLTLPFIAQPTPKLETVEDGARTYLAYEWPALVEGYFLRDESLSEPADFYHHLFTHGVLYFIVATIIIAATLLALFYWLTFHFVEFLTRAVRR